MAQVKFRYVGKDYVVNTKPLSQDLYVKWFLPMSSVGDIEPIIKKRIEEETDPDKFEKFTQKLKALNELVSTNPIELGRALTENFTVDGEIQNRPLTIGEALRIFGVVMEQELPTEDELKNSEE